MFYVSGDAIFFGESAGADRWIARNVKGARKAPGPVSVKGRTRTEVAPGVSRYDAPTPAPTGPTPGP